MDMIDCGTPAGLQWLAQKIEHISEASQRTVRVVEFQGKQIIIVGDKSAVGSFAEMTALQGEEGGHGGVSLLPPIVLFQVRQRDPFQELVIVAKLMEDLLWPGGSVAQAVNRTGVMYRNHEVSMQALHQNRARALARNKPSLRHFRTLR